jgi:subtilisin family serine protease
MGNMSVTRAGIAPAASLYNVQVLDACGQGTVSQVLEGIDWVLYHAKEYNIRVINLSLAAASGTSWRVDPLALAARSAVAAGITVVAAAGNAGYNATGREQYGGVGSPGHDPSVITVGSSNDKGTVARNDDLVNRFSSRGPPRRIHLEQRGQEPRQLPSRPGGARQPGGQRQPPTPRWRPRSVQRMVGALVTTWG